MSLLSSSRGVSLNVRSIIPFSPSSSGLRSFDGGSTSCDRNKKEINSDTETVRSEGFVGPDRDIIAVIIEKIQKGIGCRV